MQIIFGFNFISFLGYNLAGTTSAINTGQKGLGVTIASVNHVRDVFLDAAYRKESGRQQFYEVQYEAAFEMQEVMGELDSLPDPNDGKNPAQVARERARTRGDAS